MYIFVSFFFCICLSIRWYECMHLDLPRWFCFFFFSVFLTYFHHLHLSLSYFFSPPLALSLPLSSLFLLTMRESPQNPHRFFPPPSPFTATYDPPSPPSSPSTHRPHHPPPTFNPPPTTHLQPTTHDPVPPFHQSRRPHNSLQECDVSIEYLSFMAVHSTTRATIPVLEWEGEGGERRRWGEAGKGWKEGGRWWEEGGGMGRAVGKWRGR